MVSRPGPCIGLLILIAALLPATAAPLACAVRAPQPEESAPETAVDAAVRERRQRDEALQKARAFGEQAMAAIKAGQLANAAELLGRQLELEPGSFVASYNLACVRAQLGDIAGAEASLRRAIENGFDDVRQLRRDPNLAAIREGETYKALIANWGRILDARRDANIEQANRLFAKGYTQTRDETLRLVYLSAMDPQSTARAKAEIERLAAWARQAVFPEVFEPSSIAEDPWVVIVLPSRQDFLRWAIGTYGLDAVTGVSSVGGAYDHDTKRLVSQDLGSSLRHEFFHVLHWRSCMRLGQVHDIWVQEGLCSLVEDYDALPGGGLSPASSWRSNIVKRLEKAGRLEPIEKFIAVSRGAFMESRPLASYAYARELFLYLSDKGKLGEWYRAYTAAMEKPATDHAARSASPAVAAFTTALGLSMPDINRDFRMWVRGKPAVPEEIATGGASLGLEVDNGTGEGPIIASVVRRRAGVDSLALGDTITAIDGRPTRDLAELVRVLSNYKPGDAVDVEYRRGQRHGSARITLVAKQ